MFNVIGIDKALLLKVLYNRARAQGMGVLFAQSGDMDINEARRILKGRGYECRIPKPGQLDDRDEFHGDDEVVPLYFDYLKGRVMKIDIAPDEIDTRLYNRDNGRDAAEDAILDELTRPGSLRSEAL